MKYEFKCKYKDSEIAYAYVCAKTKTEAMKAVKAAGCKALKPGLTWRLNEGYSGVSIKYFTPNSDIMKEDLIW